MIDRRLFRSEGKVSPEQRNWPNFRGAIKEAMREEMRRDAGVFQMEEDIAGASPFGVTAGLVKEFGPERLRDTPCSEVAVLGAAIGAAMGGMRAIMEFQFGDLKAAPRRLGNPGVPVPFEPSLEDTVLPTTEKIIKAAKELMAS